MNICKPETFTRLKRSAWTVVAAATLVVAGATASHAEKLRVGYLKFVTFGGIAVAETKGWYKDAGLDVELLLFDSGPPLLEAMASGSVDVGALGGVPVLRLLSQQVFPLRILSAVADVSSSVKIVAKDEFKSLADLRGKDVSIPWGTTQHFVMAKALAQYGLTTDDVNLIQMEAIDAQAALVAGRLDATIPVPSSIEQILAARDDLHIVFEPADFKTPVSVFDVWVAPEDVLETRADDIKKLLSIWHGQVVPYLAEGNLDELENWLNKTVGSVASKEEIQAKLDELTMYDTDAIATIVNNGEFERMLQEQAEFMASVDILPAVPDIGAAMATGVVGNK